jgi:hypothetical protein
MTEHALLSASGAHRWTNCPGSIKAAEGIPERTSSYAEEGTIAHEIAAHCVRGRVEVSTVTTDPELRAHLPVYTNAVLAAVEPGDTLLVEQRVDLAPLNPPAPMFGTADAIVIKPRRRRVHVIDLKYGAGVTVEAENNLQTRYYGLGALLGLPPNVIVDAIELSIVQPRIPHPAGPLRREIITTSELLAWGRELLGAAHRALAPEAPLVPGPWCGFCLAKLTCPALHAQSLVTAQNDFTVYAA